MKVLLAQPAVPRFAWELEVLLTNMRQFTDMEVVLLFTRHDPSIPKRLVNKYDNVTAHVYDDQRGDGSYIPSIRPWLLWQYLKGDTARERETYFYIDSDIIFREWPNLHKFTQTGKFVLGADCPGYIDYDYIVGCERGPELAAKMAEICGITVEQMKGVPGVGAQLILSQPRAEFWHRSFQDSNRIWHYFETVDTNLQKWTAEMWAQLWGWVRDGYTVAHDPELDFCRPTDDIAEWDKFKIMHNAGVTGPGQDMFFKGTYTEKTPFDEDFSYINPNKVSAKYVTAIRNVVL